jgi:hypothetical protein
LFAAVTGQAATAPAAGLALFKRAAWIAEHHWTFEQYDNAKAADILFQAEYDRLIAARREYQEQQADG